MASSRPLADRVADAAPAPLSRAERLAAARAWIRALAFSLVAWGALLGAVFGGSAGVVTHTMAAKPASGSPHWQRQAGASSATRSARRDQAQLHAQPQLAAELHAHAFDNGSGDSSAQGFALEAASRRAQAPSSAAAAPRLKPRRRAPPSRAPPTLA